MLEDARKRELEAWLEEFERHCRQRNVSHSERPLEACAAWDERNQRQTVPIGRGAHPENTFIFNWYAQNGSPRSSYGDSPFLGAFFWDQTFWPIRIDVVFAAEVDPLRTFHKMPEVVVYEIARSPGDLKLYLDVWSDCVDIGTHSALFRSNKYGKFPEELLLSGFSALSAANQVVLRPAPNSHKAIFDAREGTEKLLKGFAAARGGLTREDAANTGNARKNGTGVGHNLEKLWEFCWRVSGHPDLIPLKPRLGEFPVHIESYEGKNWMLDEVWQAIRTAQMAAAFVCRQLSGDDVRKSIAFV